MLAISRRGDELSRYHKSWPSIVLGQHIAWAASEGPYTSDLPLCLYFMSQILLTDDRYQRCGLIRQTCSMTDCYESDTAVRKFCALSLRTVKKSSVRCVPPDDKGTSVSKVDQADSTPGTAKPGWLYYVRSISASYEKCAANHKDPLGRM